MTQTNQETAEDVGMTTKSLQVQFNNVTNRYSSKNNLIDNEKKAKRDFQKKDYNAEDQNTKGSVKAKDWAPLCIDSSSKNRVEVQRFSNSSGFPNIVQNAAAKKVARGPVPKAKPMKKNLTVGDIHKSVKQDTSKLPKEPLSLKQKHQSSHQSNQSNKFQNNQDGVIVSQ